MKSKLKCLLLAVSCVMAGIGLAVAYGAYLHYTEPMSPEQELVHRWNLRETTSDDAMEMLRDSMKSLGVYSDDMEQFLEGSALDKILWIPFEKAGISVYLEMDSSTEELRSIYVDKGADSASYRYKSTGRHGAPECVYSSGLSGRETAYWMDYNLDGHWDARILSAGFEILIGETWAEVSMKDMIAQAVDGRNFTFDLKAGKWIPAENPE